MKLADILEHIVEGGGRFIGKRAELIIVWNLSASVGDFVKVTIDRGNGRETMKAADFQQLVLAKYDR